MKPLHLEHWSSKPDLMQTGIDPNAYGSAEAGGEAKRKQDPNWVNRSFYYTKGASPEKQLQFKPFKYHAQVDADKVYNASADPLNLQSKLKWANDWTEYEKKIKDSGFHGYHTPGNPNPIHQNTVVMFHPVVPHSVENMKKSQFSRLAKCAMLRKADIPQVTNPGPTPASAPTLQMPTDISDKGLEAIKRRETFSPKPYGDTNGPAIGYGHTAKGSGAAQFPNIFSNKTIDEPMADKVLRADLSGSKTAIARLKNPVNQDMYDNMLSLGMNSPKALRGVINRMNAGDTAGAMSYWKGYNSPGGPGLDQPGNAKRREKEVEAAQGKSSTIPFKNADAIASASPKTTQPTTTQSATPQAPQQAQQTQNQQTPKAQQPQQAQPPQQAQGQSQQIASNSYRSTPIESAAPQTAAIDSGWNRKQKMHKTEKSMENVIAATEGIQSVCGEQKDPSVKRWESMEKAGEPMVKEDYSQKRWESMEKAKWPVPGLVPPSGDKGTIPVKPMQPVKKALDPAAPTYNEEVARKVVQIKKENADKKEPSLAAKIGMMKKKYLKKSLITGGKKDEPKKPENKLIAAIKRNLGVSGVDPIPLSDTFKKKLDALTVKKKEEKNV